MSRSLFLKIRIYKEARDRQVLHFARAQIPLNALNMNPYHTIRLFALIIVSAAAASYSSPTPCDVNMRRTVDVLDGPGVDGE